MSSTNDIFHVKKIPEFYTTLGCDRLASTEQIQTEYRARVRFLHPDKLTEVDKTSPEQFHLLQSAYSVLSDPSQKKTYDLWLDCPLPISYEEFKRNSEAIKMSMHWASPKETPMLPTTKLDGNTGITKQFSTNVSARWKEDRYQSDTAMKFRNYQL